MPTNDQTLIRQLLEGRKRAVAPDWSEADYFELFCAEQILKDYDASYDEIEEGIVGDGGDGGIDAIYVLVNGEFIHEDTDLSIYHRSDISIGLHIIQSKRTDGFPEDAIHCFISSTADLLDLSKEVSTLTAVYNAKLLAVAGKFRDAVTRFTTKLPKLAIHYYYATLGTEVHPNVKRQVGRLQELVKTHFSAADFTFDFLGARDLLELERREPLAIYTLRLAETPIAANRSFICLVALSEFYSFVTDEQGRLRRTMFDANVRDYQGAVEVNQAIRHTLLHPEDEDFWWLNNGITILADEAFHSGKALTIKNPQVVNGLQTSQELFRAFQTQQVPMPDRCLLVRVVIPQPDGSYQRIVRATNSQTTVPPASLRATDSIHRGIEAFLSAKDFYYERRKNYYKNEGRPRDKIVSISYVAQAIMAVLLSRPDDARARPSTLIKSDQDYQTVFNSDYPIQTYWVCILLMKCVEGYLRSRELSSKEVNNLKYHLAMFAAKRALNVTTFSAEQIAKFPINDIDRAFLDSCYSEVQAIYNKLGADDQVAKGPTFVEELNKRLDKLIYKRRYAR